MLQFPFALGVSRCSIASTSIVFAFNAAPSELPCDAAWVITSFRGGMGSSDWASSSPRDEDLAWRASPRCEGISSTTATKRTRFCGIVVTNSTITSLYRGKVVGISCVIATQHIPEIRDVSETLLAFVALSIPKDASWPPTVHSVVAVWGHPTGRSHWLVKQQIATVI